ncbi:MAG: hypothetical protein JWM40_3057 [Frankiales bacterium]|nr:hypothetical protein [Frankiales bacterium]
MSAFDDARVTLILADYIGIDAGGKANIIGAGFTITGATGLPAGGIVNVAMHLLVMIDLPAKYAGKEFALGMELRDDTTGEAVKVPGPTGQIDTMRIQQIVKGDRPVVPNVYLPEGLPIRVQMNIGFPTGIPLPAGHSLHWRVEIDGQHRKDWVAGFHLVGPPPGAVFGGFNTPTSIPPLTPPDQS